MMANETDTSTTLLSEKALKLSLSAPRCPPHDTVQRSLLVGKATVPNQYVSHHAESDNGQKRRIRHRLYRALQSITERSLAVAQNPHLPVGPEVSDQITRFLGGVLPLSSQNRCRDEGGFRRISDTLVTASIPLAAVFNPTAAMDFSNLSSRIRNVPYGIHPMQNIELLMPECSDDDITGLLFFVHGGAWGSGKPWFYRLVALPFLKMNMVVAIVGYRTYPTGDVNVQVQDIEAASNELSKRYPSLCGASRTQRPMGVVAMGHSSGSHITLLMLVERAKRRLVVQQQQQQHDGDSDNFQVGQMPIDAFVGLSGPYDISHHFDYEAARGVEELSPMKAACGYSREQFDLNSPARRLRQFLINVPEHEASANITTHFPRMLFVHGIEDDTVPFTSTAEVARLMRSCGVSQCEEVYIPLTAHQDTVVHFMLGGPTLQPVLDWLRSSAQVSTIPHSRL